MAAELPERAHLSAIAMRQHWKGRAQMRRAVAIAAVLLAAIHGSARAASVNIKFDGTGLGENVEWKYYNGTSWTDLTTFAGQFKMQFVSPTPAGYDSSFIAYCADIEHYLQTTETVDLLSTDLLNPSSLTPATGPEVAYLYDHFGPLVSSDLDAAGLQVAIWETLYDGETNSGLSGGNFQLVGSGPTYTSVKNKANSYLSALDGSTDDATWLRATSHPSQQNQDLVGPLSTVTTQSVPEPGPLDAGGSRGGAFGAVRPTPQRL